MKKLNNPKFYPGDKVWEITGDIEPREITVSSIEYFVNGSELMLHYNIKEPKETLINWFDDSYVDIMEERESYPASAIWTSEEKLLNSFLYLSRKKYQLERKLIKINTNK